MAEIIQSGLPNLSSDDKAKLASLVTDGHYKIINQEKGNKKSHSYMASPLPEGTSWSHIKIVIEKVDKKNLLHSKISIFVRWEFVIHTDFHEMFLENKVEEDISVQWKILLFMALWSRFAWEEPVIPNGQKVAKARLASSLGNFFKIDRFFDPFIKKGNEYVPRFEISAKDKFPIQEKYPKITEKFIFDLLDDSSIFPH